MIAAVIRWFRKPSKPVTPAQMIIIAAAMRRRSSQLVMQAEKLRMSTLPPIDL
jgi:hypothetical protein